MKELIITLTVTVLCSIINVNALQCYVCNDCPTVNRTALLECGESVISTTVPPTTLTSTAITTTSNGTAIVSNVTTSTSGITVATNATTATTAVTSAQTLTNTTTTPAPHVSAMNTTSALNNTNNNSNMKILIESREKREILDQIFKDNYRGISDFRATNNTLINYCFKTVTKVNTEEKIVRGCASRPVSSNQTVCNDMATDSMLIACQTCTTDKCNSAFTSQISLFLLIIAIPLYRLIN